MISKFALAALVAVVAAPVLAQSTPPPSTVSFTVDANMPSLRDPNLHDTFDASINDAQIVSNIELECSAGKTGLFIRQDKQCAVSGSGSVINPANRQALPRTQYAGGYIVKKDGFTDAATLAVNYLGLGKVPPSSENFSGSLNLKPELTSTGAAALRDKVLAQLKGGNDSLIDQRVDTVDVSRLFIPSAGLPGDKGCTWNGNLVFFYQTSSWSIDLTANCTGNTSYAFKGNMPWSESPGVANQTQYDLNLAIAGADSVSDDEALFAPSAEDDLFAQADGIAGQIIMAQSSMVTVKVDGEDTETPAIVNANGTFTGTNVPLDVVRSFTTLMVLISPNLYGA